MKRDKQKLLDLLYKIGAVAVIRCDSSSQLMNVALSLYAGGMRAIEITMTTPNAIEVIRSVAKEFAHQELLLGAGTVTEVEQAREAIAAGAQFIVSPTICPEVVAYCNEQQVVVAPGAMTPTEIQTAWRSGADIVKVFPANIGGPTYFRDLAGPLPGIRLMPTGGVDFNTVTQFLAAGAYAVGVGGAVVGRDLIRDGLFEEIRANADRFVSLVAEARSRR